MTEKLKSIRCMEPPVLNNCKQIILIDCLDSRRQKYLIVELCSCMAKAAEGLVLPQSVLNNRWPEQCIKHTLQTRWRCISLICLVGSCIIQASNVKTFILAFSAQYSISQMIFFGSSQILGLPVTQKRLEKKLEQLLYHSASGTFSLFPIRTWYHKLLTMFRQHFWTSTKLTN